VIAVAWPPPLTAVLWGNILSATESSEALLRFGLDAFELGFGGISRDEEFRHRRGR
jgi:hypothetical protein